MRDEVVRAAKSLPDIQIVPQTRRGGQKERSLVLCVADCHYGAEWTIRGLREEVLNAYSPEIFEARMADLLGQVRAILDREQLNHVTLLLCGDALDGMLRSSQLMRLRWGVVESCMRYAEYMARWVSALSLYADVDVYGVDGNHSEIRPLGSRRGEFENENLAMIIPRLERWYGRKIQCEESLLNNYRFTFKVRDESLDVILFIMRQSAPLQYKKNTDESYILTRIK